jgi:hypothetical protein
MPKKKDLVDSVETSAIIKKAPDKDVGALYSVN